MDIREVKKETIKKMIIDKAKEVFAEKGFLEAKITDIASRCNIATGTIYNYFKNKEELFVAVIKYSTEEIFRVIERAGNNIEDPIEILKTKLYSLINILKEESTYKFFVMLHRLGSGFIWQIKLNLTEIVHQRYIKFLELIKEPIQRGIEQDIFIKEDPIVIGTYITGVVNSFIFLWLSMPSNYPIEDCAIDKIINLILNGIGKKQEIKFS